jgi:hypothetical protein
LFRHFGRAVWVGSVMGDNQQREAVVEGVDERTRLFGGGPRGEWVGVDRLEVPWVFVARVNAFGGVP